MKYANRPQSASENMTHRPPASAVSIDIQPTDDGWMTRPRALAAVLVVATAIVFWLCYCLVVPFLPALAWGLALAVIAHPVHRRIQKTISRSDIAAGYSVALVLILIVAPVAFVSNTLIQEAQKTTETVRKMLESGEWRRRLEANERLKPVVGWLSANFLGSNSSDEEDKSADPDATSGEAGNKARAEDEETASGSSAVDPASPPVASSPKPSAATLISTLGGKGEQMAGRAISMVSSGLGAAIAGTVWVGMQLFITLMCLFYFLRDRPKVLKGVRSLMPLSPKEADEVFAQVDDAIHATIFGSLMVALVQGFMGGLMFWLLGIPSPVLWGAIMGLLAVVPVLGTFVIWAPTAVFLALHGEWGKALILASWGGIAIGLIDNLLYPYLVGKRLRFHTILVFFATVGGLAQFGASGIILGPLILAAGGALLEIWKRRTANGGTLEVDVECAPT